ncbi:hypothetical protein BaRGS_00034595 [Batillaria attramentaria]|uniref:Uncharacterized protein n=1 Tax=Batillaria attramentaria TaxID=370345 RepID=A0ABD0JHF8_9CAEN
MAPNGGVQNPQYRQFTTGQMTCRLALGKYCIACSGFPNLRPCHNAVGNLGKQATTALSSNDLIADAGD